MQLSLSACLLLVSSVSAALPVDLTSCDPLTKVEHFAQKRAQVLRLISRGATDIVRYRAIEKVFTDVTKADKTAPNKSAVAAFWSSITPKEVEDNVFLQDLIASYILVNKGHVSKHLKNPKVVRRVLNSVIKSATVADIEKKVAAAFDSNAFEVLGQQAFAEARGIAANLQYIAPETIKFMNSKPNNIQAYCPFFYASDLKNFKPGQLKMFTPLCFSKMAGFDAVVDGSFAKYAKSLGPDLYKYFSNVKLSDKLLEEMTGEQLKNFGTGVSDQTLERCAKLDLSKVKRAAIKSIDGNCLASNAVHKSLKIERNWQVIPATIFSKLDEVFADYMATIAAHIAPEDKQYMSIAQFNEFNKLKKFPKNFRTTTADIRNTQGASLELDGKTAAKMQDKVIVAHALRHSVKLADDVLAYVDANFFTGLEIKIGTNTYEGIEVLNHIQAPNKIEIIKNLGTKTTGNHPCSVITSFDEFKKVKALNQYASDACIRAMRITATLEEMKEFPRLINCNLIDTMQSDDYSKMTAAFAKALFRTDFCSVIDMKNFMKLSQEAQSVVGPECLISLSFVSKLTPETLHRFADDAFALVSTDVWKANGLTWDSLNDKQLAHLSVSVASKDMVTATFTPATIEKLGDRAQLLSAKQVASLTEETLVALPVSKMSATAFNLVSAAQAKAILAKSAAFLTADQVVSMGAAGSEKDAVLKTLQESAQSLSRTAFTALQKRIADAADAKAVESEDSRINPYLLYGGISLVAVVILGAGVMFFFRSNN